MDIAATVSETARGLLISPAPPTKPNEKFSPEVHVLSNTPSPSGSETLGRTAQSSAQGAVPDVAYTDPGDGKEKIVELKLISMCPSRYGRQVATSLPLLPTRRCEQARAMFNYIRNT